MKVYELYSGIGGMHFALRESGINAKVIRAIDINPTANAVYKLNFPETALLEGNIQNLDSDDFDNIGMILMSPPCQPHTRNGLKKDTLDNRSDSLLHFITLLPKFRTIKYILLENVKGFELSEIRNEIIKLLLQNNFVYQEFLLTPVQFAIPNSRLRYYLLAKKKPMQFCFPTENIVMERLPELRHDVSFETDKLARKYVKLSVDESLCYPIGLVIDKEATNEVPEKVLKKYGTLFDIVTAESVKSCCFTKSYSHFVEGTGSVFSPKSTCYVNEVCKKLKDSDNNFDSSFDLLKSLQLRYFTPKEISKLMAFPDDFKFPNFLSDKQKYRLLGNSINVHVVSILIRILVS